MRRRFLESLGVAVVLVGLIVLLQSSVSLSGQAPAGESSTAAGPAPKTAWGASGPPGHLAR